MDIAIYLGTVLTQPVEIGKYANFLITFLSHGQITPMFTL